MVSEYS